MIAPSSAMHAPAPLAYHHPHAMDAVHALQSVRYQLRRGLAQLPEWPIAQLDDLRVHRLALPLLLLDRGSEAVDFVRGRLGGGFGLDSAAGFLLQFSLKS